MGVGGHNCAREQCRHTGEQCRHAGVQLHALPKQRLCLLALCAQRPRQPPSAVPHLQPRRRPSPASVASTAWCPAWLTHRWPPPGSIPLLHQASSSPACTPTRRCLRDCTRPQAAPGQGAGTATAQLGRGSSAAAGVAMALRRQATMAGDGRERGRRGRKRRRGMPALVDLGVRGACPSRRLCPGSASR